LHRVRTPLDPHTELLLLFASRAQNVAEVIRPALAKGKIVLSDRFTDASLAYQGYGRGLDRRFIRELNRFACQGLQPDLSFVLDIDPRLSVERARQRQRGRPSRARSQDRFEREALAFYRRVRRGYRELARREPRRVQWIHAQDTIERVQERILERAGWVIDAARRRHGPARGRRP
jgi:dTMP kinase